MAMTRPFRPTTTRGSPRVLLPVALLLLLLTETLVGPRRAQASDVPPAEAVAAGVTA